jgi:PilZ domain-containing protein
MHVLAFEADPNQTEGIRHVVCDVVGARLTVATSLDHLLHALREETPDLVLLPALVSPSQENALFESLRSLPHASHVETLLTPVLPPREPAAASQGWRRWTRRASTPAMTAETEQFAGRVHWALERAREKRAHALDACRELPPTPEPSMALARRDADAADQLDAALSEPVIVESADLLATRLVEPVVLAVEPVPVIEAAPSLLRLLEGSSDQRVTAPEDLELEDATSRLLKKLSHPETRQADRRDRRQYRRFTASELPGLRSARIRSGPDVELVDVSAGGILLETNARLQPESEALLELFGSARQVVVPFRVLRCQIAAIDGSPKYLGACVFKEPLDLDELTWASIDPSVLEPRVPALTLVQTRTVAKNAW